MRRIIAAVAVATALAGCGDSDVTGAEAPTTVRDELAPSTTTTPSTTRATLALPTTTRPSDYAMGSTLTVTPGDHKVTVYSYKPVTSDSRFNQPKAGFSFAAIDIQQCAGPTGDRFGPNRFDWELAMPDNTRLKAGTTVAEPQLGSSPLGPNDCIRGFVTFEVPTGATPRHVVYNEVTTGAAKWRVA